MPLLQSLKEKGILIGLISNCFSEEARVIRESILFPYFDAAYLSFEQKVQKPNPMIFERCMSELGVTAKECLYVGDGGSNELSGAKNCGITTVLTEFLTVKDSATRENILKSADFVVQDFKQLIDIVIN